MAVPQNLSKEEQILKLMKKVLTDIAKETFTRPGLKHPLTDNTIHNIRDCLALITVREVELSEQHGRPMEQRPKFADEPQTRVVVPINSLKPSTKDD